MALHSKSTYISLDGVDISTYTNASAFNRNLDSHDITTYGLDDHAFGTGLKVSTVSLGGFYAVGVSGTPSTVIEPIWDAADTVTLIRRLEGTGSGKPQESCSVQVLNYVESSPVADYIQWTAELQVSGAVDKTTQGA